VAYPKVSQDSVGAPIMPKIARVQYPVCAGQPAHTARLAVKFWMTPENCAICKRLEGELERLEQIHAEQARVVKDPLA
jgi:hypothetical protein